MHQQPDGVRGVVLQIIGTYLGIVYEPLMVAHPGCSQAYNRPTFVSICQRSSPHSRRIRAANYIVRNKCKRCENDYRRSGITQATECGCINYY